VYFNDKTNLKFYEQ